jgi:hypothetical protein
MYCCRIDVAEDQVKAKLFRKAELRGDVDLDGFETNQVPIFTPLLSSDLTS